MARKGGARASKRALLLTRPKGGKQAGKRVRKLGGRGRRRR